MQSAQEIMTIVANKHSYNTWDELMYDSHAHTQIEVTESAMKEYAKQACYEQRNECAKAIPFPALVTEDDILNAPLPELK